MCYFRALEISSLRINVFVTGCSENGKISHIAMASRNMTPRCWKAKISIYAKLVKKSHSSCTISRTRVVDVWLYAQRYFIHTYSEMTVDASMAHLISAPLLDDT